LEPRLISVEIDSGWDLGVPIWVQSVGLGTWIYGLPDARDFSGFYIVKKLILSILDAHFVPNNYPAPSCQFYPFSQYFKC